MPHIFDANKRFRRHPYIPKAACIRPRISSSSFSSYVTTELKDDEKIRGRIQKALGMYGCLRKHLPGVKGVWYSAKKKALTGMVLPTMLDGAESWVVSAKAMKELRSVYNRIVRGCCRVSLHTTRKHRVTTKSLQSRLRVAMLEHYLDWRILGHAGHVMRVADGRLPKPTMQGRIEGNGRVVHPQVPQGVTHRMFEEKEYR